MKIISIDFNPQINGFIVPANHIIAAVKTGIDLIQTTGLAQLFGPISNPILKQHLECDERLLWEDTETKDFTKIFDYIQILGQSTAISFNSTNPAVSTGPTPSYFTFGPFIIEPKNIKLICVTK